MQPEDFRITGEGPPFDRVADQHGPVVSIVLQRDGGRNSGGESLTGFRSHFIAEGVSVAFAVKALPVSDSGPVSPIHDILTAPLADTGHN